MPTQQHTHRLPTAAFSRVPRLYLTVPPPNPVNTPRALRAHAPTRTAASTTPHAPIDILHQGVRHRIAARLLQQLAQHPTCVALPYPLQHLDHRRGMDLLGLLVARERRRLERTAQRAETVTCAQELSDLRCGLGGLAGCGRGGEAGGLQGGEVEVVGRFGVVGIDVEGAVVYVGHGGWEVEVEVEVVLEKAGGSRARAVGWKLD